ncbi:tRNA (cytidine(34)-2'-O)-methyltransferase [Lutibaculum baratangense]|uniref:tRNA (cytidine(34)-2'-O)-methyltransferase n=1 Tax=Lutibaculum baratangense TaxID=1358440 RepID=UPI000687FFA3|nr:tRNA (cytidine(34)-2'-O)-methyltransferase [Lutibaculum baratangense]
MRLALYEPDIPQNTGTILRLAACLGLAVDIIEPAGFPWSERSFRRAGMDYLDHVAVRRHVDFDAFEGSCRAACDRIVLLTTRGSTPHLDFAYRRGDVLLLGSEGAGVPLRVHERADARVVVPMRPGLRSLNIAMAAALVVGEAMRQTGWATTGEAPTGTGRGGSSS